MYQVSLVLPSGPRRMDGRWRHRLANQAGVEHTQAVLRDYWVALSEHAGLLWIYQMRLEKARSARFLQGVFA